MRVHVHVVQCVCDYMQNTDRERERDHTQRSMNMYSTARQNKHILTHTHSKKLFRITRTTPPILGLFVTHTKEAKSVTQGEREREREGGERGREGGREREREGREREGGREGEREREREGREREGGREGGREGERFTYPFMKYPPDCIPTQEIKEGSHNDRKRGQPLTISLHKTQNKNSKKTQARTHTHTRSLPSLLLYIMTPHQPHTCTCMYRA